jgi:predicted ATPase
MLDRYAEQLVAHGREHEQPQWVLWGNYLQGPVLTAAGQASEAITRIDQALQTAERMQNRAFRPMVYGILAEAKLALGDGDGAIQRIDDALSLAEQTLERWMIPELLRIKGNILLSAGIQGIAVIEECFQSSIESAKRQGSRMFELRSSISLVRCWHEIRKTAQARKLIEPIYNGFTEGFDTLELKEAKTLLDELAQ